MKLFVVHYQYLWGEALPAVVGVFSSKENAEGFIQSQNPERGDYYRIEEFELDKGSFDE